MATIWTFGDSMTAGDGCLQNLPVRDGGDRYYKEYKKEDDDIWPNILSKSSGYDVLNFGKSGASNDYIIDCIIDNFNNINDGDVVIIEKTFYERFDIPKLNKNEFHTQYGESLSTMAEDLKNNKYDKDKIEIETILNYGILFASHNLFKERQNRRLDFIKKQLKKKNAKVYNWDILNFMDGRIETIMEHTKNEIFDIHFSFNGHKQFAEMMHKIIFVKKTLL